MDAQTEIESYLDISGFWDLRFEDQLLIQRFLAGDTGEHPPVTPALSPDQDAIRCYNELVYAVADELRSVNSGFLTAALEANGQEPPKTRQVDLATACRGYKTKSAFHIYISS
jgi:hypothetical protein